MNEEVQSGKITTVLGRALNYHIDSCVDPNSGYTWVTLTQSDANGANKSMVYIDPQLISGVCTALQSAGQAAPSEFDAKTTRQLPEECFLLQNRHARKSWDNGEDALLVHLYLEGYSISQIAVRLGRTYMAIVARLKQYEFTQDLEG